MKLLGKAGGKPQQGDTIIEVILVTALLGLVLVISFGLTNHAFQDGVDSNKRTEGLGYAQRQVESIKNAYNHNQNTLKNNYIGSSFSNFCIDSTGAVKNADTDAFCKNYNNSLISIGVTYDPTKQIFTVTSSWDAVNGTKNKVSLYYKTPLLAGTPGGSGGPLINLVLDGWGFAPTHVWLYTSVNPEGNNLDSCFFNFDKIDAAGAGSGTFPNFRWQKKVNNNPPTDTTGANPAVHYKSDCIGLNDNTSHNVTQLTKQWDSGSSSCINTGNSSATVGNNDCAADFNNPANNTLHNFTLDNGDIVYYNFCVTSGGAQVCSSDQYGGLPACGVMDTAYGAGAPNDYRTHPHVSPNCNLSTFNWFCSGGYTKDSIPKPTWC